MAEHDATVQLYHSGGWQDTTADVYQRDPISIRRGLADETLEPTPGSAALTYDNRDGTYNPNNPTSPLYGLVGRNTPLRIQLPPTAASITDTFSRTEGSSWGSAPGGGTYTNTGSGGSVLASDFDVTGGTGTHDVTAANAYRMSYLDDVSLDDVDLYTECILIVNPAGGALEPTLMLRGQSTSTYYMARVVVGTDNSVTAQIRQIVSAAETLLASGATAVTHSIGTALKVRLRAHGNTLQMRVWQGATEPSIWHAQATSTAIGDPGWVGIRSGVASGNTNPSRLFSYDSFIVTPYDTRISGEVAEWKPRRSLEPVAATRGDAWTLTTGAGILRRLGQGQKPLRAALDRAVRAAGPLEWWPLDDGKDSVSFASAAGGAPLVPVTTLPTPAALAGPVGAPPPVPLLIDDGAYTGAVTAAVVDCSSTAWSVTGCWHTAAREGNLFAIEAYMLRLFTDGTIGSGWWEFLFRVDPARLPQLTVRAYSTTGSVEQSIGSGLGTSAVADWHHWRLSCQQVGADIEVELWTDGELRSSETWAGDTMGAIRAVQAGQYEVNTQFVADPSISDSYVEAAALANVAIFNTADPGDHYPAMVGHAGETAAARILRLCGEEGITAEVVGVAADTVPMGAQPTEKLLEILAECARTDAGMLYELRDRLGLAYRTRVDLYNQTPALTLDYSAGEVAPPLEPIVGDYGVRNDVTAARRGGSSYQAVLESGSLSILAPPDGVGRYDTRLDTNPETDAALEHLAWWHVAKGTVGLTRYRTITVDLDSQPAVDASLAAAAATVDIGDRVTLTGLPAADSPDDVDGLVTSIAETIARRRRLVALTTVPAVPYSVAVVEGAGAPAAPPLRLDTGGAALNAAVDADDTTLTVVTTGNVRWVDNATWPDDFPFDLDVAGERVTVTAGTASDISLVATGAADHGVNSARTPALPGGSTAAGDVMVCLAAIRNSGTGTVDPISGWTTLVNFGNIHLQAKVHSGSEVAPTVTFTGGVAGATCSAQITAVRGLSHDLDSLVAEQATQLSGSAQNIAYPALTRTAWNTKLIIVGWKQDDWTSVATLAGMSEIGDAASTGGDDHGIVWDHLTVDQAASVPAGEFTVTGGAAAISRAVVMALRGTQTFTVTRAVNGVQKAHPAGTPVRLWRPPRVAL